MSSSDQKLSSTGDSFGGDSSGDDSFGGRSPSARASLERADYGPDWSPAHPIDSLKPHMILPLLEATLGPVPEHVGDEPEWHVTLVRAESECSGYYPDEDCIPQVKFCAKEDLRRAARAIRNLPEGTNLDAVRASLIAHTAAAAGRAGLISIDSPILTECAYCLKRYDFLMRS